MADPKTSAVVLVDMARDFIEEGGFIANAGGEDYRARAKAIVDPLQRLVAAAREAGAKVVYSTDAHTPDDLEMRKDEAEKKLVEYNEKLAQLEKEAAQIVEDYIKQGHEAKARILKEAESTAEKLKIQARRNIEHEFEQAKSKLQKEIFETSLEKAEKIVKAKISDEDQDRIVDEYLKKVVA